MSIDNIFRHNSGLRFINKSKNAQERENFSRWYKEQISQYGVEVEYQQMEAALGTADYDPVYGEAPSKPFAEPLNLIMFIELNENALTLTQFGINADDEVTAYIHIDSFYSALDGDGEAKTNISNIEPKAGDIFRLSEYGNDRVYPRTGALYEITERLDQDVEKINPLIGHYVWYIKAKRFDYSFEVNVTPEGGSTQVDEENIYDPNEEIDESYLTIASKDIFDYGDYGGGDSVYGDYY